MNGFRTREVIERTGATPRQLDYWDRVGFLGPSVKESGYNRGESIEKLYSQEDVERIALAVRLLSAGISLNAMRRLGSPEAMLARLRRFVREEDAA